MTTRTRKRIDFAELGWLAARIGRATVTWRRKMGLGPIPEDLDPEEVAEGARELSWRHPEARGGRS